MESAKEIDRPTKRQRFDEEIDQSSSSSSPPLPPPATPEEFLPAAAQGDDATVASALRNPRVDPNMTNQDGSTALIMASERDEPSEVKLLLADKRVDPNITDKKGDTAFILAAAFRHTSVVKLLLADGRVDPNIADKDGETAIDNAAREANGRATSLDILRLLLADDRVIRTRPDDGGDNYDAALAWLNRQGTDEAAAPVEFLPAARCGDDATVTSALRNSLVDPNTTDWCGDTAINEASRNGNTSVVKLLLADKRVDPNTANQYGDTALGWAARSGHVPVLELLLADHRTIRTRPPKNQHSWDLGLCRSNFDRALLNVKRPRNARFRGLTRLMVVFRRMRLRAALTVYAPGGTGFAVAAASFNAAAANI